MQNPFLLNMQDPTNSFLQGVAIDQELQAAKAQQEMQRQLSADMYGLYSNPNAGAKEYSAMLLKYPQMADNIKKSWEILSPEVQSTHISDMGQVLSATRSGRPDIAVALLRDRATAYRNSGDEQKAQGMERLADLGEINPQGLDTSVSMTMSSVLGPEKFGETLDKLVTQRKQEALLPYEVSKAATDAAYQEEGTVLDIQKKAEDVKSSQLDQKIKVIDAKLRMATSDIEKEKLQIDKDKLILERDKAAAETGKAAADETKKAQRAIDAATMGLETVNELINHPGLTSGTGAGSNFAAWFNGSDAADFRSGLKTLQAQQFLSNVELMKGTGQLSDAEGARLENAIASLGTEQSDKQMMANLVKIRDALNKAQQKQISTGSAPMQGGPVVFESKRYGKVMEGDINRVMAANPGATRDQIIRFLQSQ